MAVENNSYKLQEEAFDANNSSLRLIVICLAFFAAFGVMWGVWLFSNPKETVWAAYNKDILGWFVVPVNPTDFLYKPWTIITYPFADHNFLTVFPNLFWLGCFGYILQDVGGYKKVIPLFFYGTIGGALFFLLANSLFPNAATNTLVGAGPGVMAVVIATTIIAPRYKLFPLINGGLPLWVLSIIYLGANILLVGIDDTGALAAQLGGAVAAVAFILLFKNRIDIGTGVNDFLDWMNNLFNSDRPKMEKDIKNELFYKVNVKPFVKFENQTEQIANKILDKINITGYSSLTDVEKELLEKAAQSEL